MKTTTLMAFAFLLSTNVAFSQITIQCPADQTVALFDLDSDYETYGDPIVNTPNTYVLTSDITIVENQCSSHTSTIKYVATEDNTGNTAFCVQVITITQPSVNDIIWPSANSELTAGTPADLNPDLNLVERPEPYDLLHGESDVYVAYEDVVIQASPSIPYKVIRTWTGLDWCTSQTATFVQILKINQVSGANLGVLDVETCFGGQTTAQAVNVTTDQANFTLNTDNCEILNNNITDYLNCVADENAIDANSSIIVNLQSQNDALNGVSTLDMVIAQRHILAIDQLDSDCKTLAADVNSDGKVSAIDLLVMRKLILGIFTEWPSTPSWVFINGSDISKGLSFKKSEFPLQNVNILAVKKGDVNGTAN